ncbi:osmoprotectant transport system permease protein [Tindallia magadiensis]|uniref:Osmoprotectant transport system permease protein n=1 Tax=Tindallia magadiensis TaxID=69895 RepID=A0A1I3CUD5_9FIRM|nr:ABC transporter permease [Tindallia magadiensis]SFH77879.1 osmoprotectant transport system permease protein [Tindallia magadiensis]
MIFRIFALYRERSSFFVELFIQHLYITMIAVLFITTIGLTVGILMTRNRWLAGGVLRVTSFLYTIPSIALFGVLVSLTGIGLKSALTAIVLYGLLPMIRSTYTGLKEVDREVVEAAVGMGSTPWQLLYRIQLPLAFPVIFSGFRTMVVMTIALGGIASFIGAGGMGRAIWRGISTNFPEMTIAGSLLIAALAILADCLLEMIEKLVRYRFLGEGGK